MKNSDKLREWMKQGQALLDSENMPSNEDQQMKAKMIQQSMDMGGESPNQPNLSEDALGKDEGGFKSNFNADGGGQTDAQAKELRKRAMAAMYKG